MKMSDKVDNPAVPAEKQKNTRPKAKDFNSLSKALKANLLRRKIVKKNTPPQQ